MKRARIVGMTRIHLAPGIAYPVGKSVMRELRDHIVRVGKKVVPLRGKRDLVRSIILDAETRAHRGGATR